MVTITAPKSKYVDNNDASTYTLKWTNAYSGQYGFAVLYKLKSSASWLTTGIINSTATSYDLRNINNLLGIDIDEIQYRLVVYYKTSDGTETRDFSDAAYIYSLIFNSGISGHLKVNNGSTTIDHPTFTTIKNNNIEKLNIQTDSGKQMIPLVDSSSPLAGKTKIKTNSGVKNLATNNANFTYDTTKLTTYGTATANYTSYSSEQSTGYKQVSAAYNSYSTGYNTLYKNYGYTEYVGSYYKYTTYQITTRYDSYNYNYYEKAYYTYYSNLRSYTYTPSVALPAPLTYAGRYGMYADPTYYSYSVRYVVGSTEYGPIWGGYGGGGISYYTMRPYYYYYPTSYYYYYAPQYTGATGTYEARYSRYKYVSGYSIGQYGPYALYRYGYYVSGYGYYYYQTMVVTTGYSFNTDYVTYYYAQPSTKYYSYEVSIESSHTGYYYYGQAATGRYTYYNSYKYISGYVNARYSSYTYYITNSYSVAYNYRYTVS